MTIKVFDEFNGANNTDIASHTPDIDVEGGGWNQTGANTVELDGSGAIKFSTSNDSCWIDVAATDQTVITNYNAGGTDNRIGVRLRSNNTDSTVGTYYYFNFKPDTLTDTIAIFRRVSGTLTALGSASLNLSTSTPYKLECRAIGSTLEFFVDDVLELTIIDAVITTGDYAGLLHARYTNGNARFFDFQAEDQDAGGLIVDSLISPQGIENILLSTVETVSPDNLISQQFITEPSITQGYILSVDSIVTGQSIENVSLAVSGQLNVDSLQSLQLLSSPTLTQSSQISVDGLINTQSLSESILSTGDELIVQNIGSIQSISDSEFIQQHVLITNNITNTQLLGVVTFSGEGQDIGTVTAAFKESDIDVTYGIANFTVMFKD